MRNLRCIAVALLFIATLSAFAEKVATMPAPNGYINDYAGVLTAPAKAELESLCRELQEKTKAQIFVVTIKTLGGESVDTFSNQLFHKWKIGEKKTDHGLLILLAINDHQRRIEVGTRFEGLINDAKAGDIGREMVPDLKASDYDGAVKIAVDRLAQIVAADSNVTLDALADQPGAQPDAALLNDSAPPTRGSGTAFAAIGCIIFSFIAITSFIIWRVRRAIKQVASIRYVLLPAEAAPTAATTVSAAAATTASVEAVAATPMVVARVEAGDASPHMRALGSTASLFYATTVQ